ncbi:hypothetical protein DPMN_070052 [Dreissena polymorpha]|uniref:Uncharacterized protein n=1 Tax=Dreissena polymorpha TaxID=45954 RepID=A0A9D4BNL7_DREPO|nr:hypothetical protein DPMN_070052 [Dreissena polymorpha]
MRVDDTEMRIDDTEIRVDDTEMRFDDTEKRVYDTEILLQSVLLYAAENNASMGRDVHSITFSIQLFF